MVARLCELHLQLTRADWFLVHYIVIRGLIMRKALQLHSPLQSYSANEGRIGVQEEEQEEEHEAAAAPYTNQITK